MIKLRLTDQGFLRKDLSIAQTTNGLITGSENGRVGRAQNCKVKIKKFRQKVMKSSDENVKKSTNIVL